MGRSRISAARAGHTTALSRGWRQRAIGIPRQDQRQGDVADGLDRALNHLREGGALAFAHLGGLRLPGIVFRVLGGELLQDVGAVGGDGRLDDVVLLGDRLVFVAELACGVFGVGFLVD